MKIAEVALKYKTHVPVNDMPKIECPEDALLLLRSIWNEDTIQLREEFAIILLNNAKRCLGWSRISAGGSTCTIVDVTTIFQLALLSNSNSIILAHNHPSGYLKASTADINLTRRIKKAGGYFGIPIEDHIILTAENYYSFRENGLV